jgi:mono/diheme cytochrome c family protein
MTRKGKVLRVGLLVLLIALVVGISFTTGWRPFIGPRKRELTNRQFQRTPERVARGRYLTQAVLGCVICHSPKNFAIHGAPTVEGMDLAGQVLPMPDLPGAITAPNITPDRETGGGSWTDDEFARAIREGISHDGRTIFPMMPYTEYRKLSDEDLASVVVYLRSVPAVRNRLPPTKVKFPVNYLVQGAPEPVREVVPGPDPADRIATGRYLATLGCGCHRAVETMAFGGGENLKGPWGETTSVNITSDPSGIGYYDEATFIKALRTGYVGARKLNTIMPFGDFQDLSDDDLKAIFAYLRTVTPVRHRVDNSLPRTYCKLCKAKHGGGDQN